MLSDMDPLSERLLAIEESLERAGLPHAFGGAIALAYCTTTPRDPGDLDVNVFVDPSQAESALRSLPAQIGIGPIDTEAASVDGRCRLWWGEIPIDVFFDTLPLHAQMSRRVRRERFADRLIPVVDPASLVAFKVLIDRDRDWDDIEAVAAHSPDQIDVAASDLRVLLSADDPRRDRLAGMTRPQ